MMSGISHHIHFHPCAVTECEVLFLCTFFTEHRRVLVTCPFCLEVQCIHQVSHGIFIDLVSFKDLVYKSIGVLLSPFVYASRYLTRVREIHIFDSCIVMIFNCLLELRKEREVLVDYQCVSHLQLDIQIHCRELLQERPAVLIQCFYAFLAISEKVDDLLLGLACRTIGRHREGVLKAQR